MNLNDKLMEALRAVAPVAGFSPGVSADWNPETVRIDFDGDVTDKQLTDAYRVLVNFDVNAAPPVEEIRKAEYEKQLGDVGNQFDAIFKGLLIIVPALIESKAISQEVAALLTPDPNAPVDTPAGWMGRVQKIKQDNPKEN